MRKFFSFIMATTLILSVGVLNGCSDDNDDSTISGSTSYFVGTWHRNSSTGYRQLSFYDNGRGLDIDVEYEDYYEEYFEWTYDSESKILTRLYSGSDVRRRYVNIISADQFSWRSTSDPYDEADTYYRVR